MNPLTVSTLSVPHISEAYKNAGCIWASKILLNTPQCMQFIFLSALKMVIIFRLAFGIKSATACVVLSLVVNAMPRYLYELTTSTSASPYVSLSCQDRCPPLLNTTMLVFARFTSSFNLSASALRLFSWFCRPPGVKDTSATSSANSSKETSAMP